MFADGAKVYIRTINHQKSKGEWKINDTGHSFKVNSNPKYTNVRVYKLAFSLVLEPSQTL